MSGLNSLKLVASQPVPTINHKQIRRQKLCKKLAEQLEMARCVEAGKSYEAFVTKRVRDAETGEFQSVQQPKRVKQWWWTAEDGTTCLTVRYGTKPVELKKGCNAIETDGIAGVISSLEVVRAAVEAGELDTQLEGLAKVGKVEVPVKRPTLSLPKRV